MYNNVLKKQIKDWNAIINHNWLNLIDITKLNVNVIVSLIIIITDYLCNIWILY